MPELPEVQTVVNTLRPRLLGRKIVPVQLNRQDIAHANRYQSCHVLMGRTITTSPAAAKRIVFTLDSDERFYIHLGMSGRLGLA